MYNSRKKIAIVQHYINVRKGVYVEININSFSDTLLLEQAYIIAIQWFNCLSLILYCVLIAFKSSLSHLKD